MVRVGYISGLGIKESVKTLDSKVNDLVSIVKTKNLDLFVVNGGISSNYLLSLRFVEILGDILRMEKIKFRFLVGNTDFYYKDGVVDKESKFNEILAMYRNNRYYLPNNPVFYEKVWIMGAESWYDYSLYRGKPVGLKKLTKKSLLFKKNLDSVYITDKNDYVLGLKNLFDVKYTGDCLGLMDSMLKRNLEKMRRPEKLVVAQYFYPSQIFLNESEYNLPFSNFFNYYFGTFMGSNQFLNVMKRRGVTDCVVGLQSNRKHIRYEGIDFKCSYGNDILEVVYNV